MSKHPRNVFAFSFIVAPGGGGGFEVTPTLTLPRCLFRRLKGRALLRVASSRRQPDVVRLARDPPFSPFIPSSPERRDYHAFAVTVSR